MKTTALLWMFLAAVSSVAAREVLLLGAAESRASAPRHAVAAGGTLVLDVLIPASIDRDQIEVGLWQISGALTLPLGKPVALEGRADAHGITPVKVEFPQLERKSRVLVKFTAKDDARTVLGLVQVQVYPARDWAPLARKLKKDGWVPAVFGKDEALREFFKARDIEYSDSGDAPPEVLAAGTLAIGLLSAKDWAAHKGRLGAGGGRLIVFVADAELPPGIYTQAAGEGAVTQVTMPVLDKLGADPRAEDLLFQLIEQHIHSAPVANF